MLFNRLKILFAERNLTIKDAMEATGLSRNSLSNMINNPSANISTQNIDKLCNFLEITPSAFFDYFPFDINFQLLKHKNQKTCNDNTLPAEYELMITGVSGSILKRTYYSIIFDFNLNPDPNLMNSDILGADIGVNISPLDGDDVEFIDANYDGMSLLMQQWFKKSINEQVLKLLDGLKRKGLLKDKLVVSKGKYSVVVLFNSSNQDDYGNDENIFTSKFNF